MRIQEENEEKLSSINRQLEGLKLELDYLQSEDKKGGCGLPYSLLPCTHYRRSTGVVDKEAKKIDELRKEESSIESHLSAADEKLQEIDTGLENLKASREAKRKEFEAAEEEVMKAKHNLSEVDKVSS